MLIFQKTLLLKLVATKAWKAYNPQINQLQPSKKNVVTTKQGPFQ